MRKEARKEGSAEGKKVRKEVCEEGRKCVRKERSV